MCYKVVEIGYNSIMDDILKLVGGLFLLVATYLLSIFNRVVTGVCYTAGFMIAMELVGRLLK